jgi:hypothetical protein
MSLLDSLKPRVIEVQIDDAYGLDVKVSVATLSWARWNDIGLSVSEPEAPLKMVMEAGKKTYKPATDSPEFRAAQIEAANERTYRRLAVALQGGGSLPELAHAPMDEAVKIVKELDSGVLNALSNLLQQVAYGSKARLESRATTFLGLPAIEGEGA